MYSKYTVLSRATVFCRSLFVLLISVWLTGNARAQACRGITVAGGNGYGEGDKQLASPYAVVTDGAGYIYVADYANNRIQKFAPNSTSASSGTTVAGGNGLGAGDNQLAYPTGLAIDRAGYIYVADYSNHRIQKFALNSTSASSGTTVAGGNGKGASDKQMNYPAGIAIDEAGYIYAADNANHRIQKFAPNSTSASSGTTIAGGNGKGASDNQVAFPTGLAIDVAGNLYVADYSYRIQKFAPNSTSASSGTTVAGGNGYGSGDKELSYSFGIAVDGAGYLYVADTYNNRIQKFSSSTIGTAGIQLVADESGCPVRLRGQANGTSFVFTGPNGYVFSEVHRVAGSYQPVAINVKRPGTYQLNAVSTNECSTSAPVNQTVIVTRTCP